MGQNLCSGPDQVDIQLPAPQKSSSFIRPSEPIIIQQSVAEKDEHEPDQSFAVKQEFTPRYTQKLTERLKQLGQFHCQYSGGMPSGYLLSSSYRLKNGAIYSGQWKMGKIHGKGSYYLPDHSLLECITNQNQIIGRGRIIYANGDYYDGQIFQNQANGYGRYVQGEFVYQGYMKNNQLHGRGKQVGDKFMFEGQFDKGEKKEGKLIWFNGDRKYEYNGTFQNNLFSGRGILVSDTCRYEGSFKNGKKHGQGKYIWKDGKYFVGEFRNDKKQGQGNIFDSEGTLIDCGSWKNDKLY